MPRRSLEDINKAKKRTLSLDEALYHSAHDGPGGVPVLAIKLHKSESSLSNNLDPNQPDRRPTLEQLEVIIENSQDTRILDSITRLYTGVGWFKMLDLGYSEDKLLRVFNELIKRVASATESLEGSLENDGVIDDAEWPELQFDLSQLLGAVHGLMQYASSKRTRE